MPKSLIEIHRDGGYPLPVHGSIDGKKYTLDYDWTGPNDVSGPGAIVSNGYGTSGAGPKKEASPASDNNANKYTSNPYESTQGGNRTARRYTP